MVHLRPRRPVAGALLLIVPLAATLSHNVRHNVGEKRGRCPSCRRCEGGAAHVVQHSSSLSHRAPGRRADRDPGAVRLCRPPERAGGDNDPRHFRPAQTDDREPADGAERAHAHAQGSRRRRSHGHELRAPARLRTPQRIRRCGLSHLRREGSQQSKAHHVREDPRQGRASFRPRRELRLHLHRDGRLCRQHPGDLRHPHGRNAGPMSASRMRPCAPGT